MERHIFKKLGFITELNPKTEQQHRSFNKNLLQLPFIFLPSVYQEVYRIVKFLNFHKQSQKVKKSKTQRQQGNFDSGFNTNQI